MKSNIDGDELNSLLEKYQTLVDAEHPEQIYQEFLEKNTRFIPREFIQNHGLHLDVVLRKLSLAKDYTTDFFYLAKSSADWHCILIEIEKPQSKYFKNGSNDFHPDFISALSQINRWRAWFNHEPNREGFINSTIRPLRVPMAQNPCYMKYVLVHGRRAEYERSEQRTALIKAHERDDFHIVSFDSLAEGLHTKHDVYIAIRKNESVDIVTEQFVSEEIFVWMDHNYLRVSQTLKNNIAANSSKWRYINPSGLKSNAKAMETILPKLIVK